MGDPLADPRAQQLLSADPGEVATLASQFRKVASQAERRRRLFVARTATAHGLALPPTRSVPSWASCPGIWTRSSSPTARSRRPWTSTRGSSGPLQTQFRSLARQLTSAPSPTCRRRRAALDGQEQPQHRHPGPARDVHDPGGGRRAHRGASPPAATSGNLSGRGLRAAEPRHDAAGRVRLDPRPCALGRVRRRRRRAVAGLVLGHDARDRQLRGRGRKGHRQEHLGPRLRQGDHQLRGAPGLEDVRRAGQGRGGHREHGGDGGRTVRRAGARRGRCRGGGRRCGCRGRGEAAATRGPRPPPPPRACRLRTAAERDISAKRQARTGLGRDAGPRSVRPRGRAGRPRYTDASAGQMGQGRRSTWRSPPGRTSATCPPA